MNDFVRIRVTYPNQDGDTEEAPGAGRGTKASPDNGANVRSRSVSGIVFAAVGAIVVLAGIAAGFILSLPLPAWGLLTGISMPGV